MERDKKEKGVCKAMQQVLGQQDVGFRSAEQELALHAVIDGQTPLVVVLPTGGGKSLLFSVPACMEDAGVTVVVVPYRALIEDLVDRMQKCGIDCMEWKHGESSPAAVVVVSADAAGDTTSNGNFLGYANMLSGKGLAAAGGGGRVSSRHHVERLAAEAGAGEESTAAAVSDRAAHSNAPAGERGRAGNEHAAPVRNVHPGEHSPTEHAVLRVVVRAW